MDFPTGARHNPAAVGQPARLINIFCINLMNSQCQLVYSVDENPPQLLYSVCSQPVRKSSITVQGRERPIFCQLLRLVSHTMLTPWCLPDTPVEVKMPCYSTELLGDSAVAIISETPGQKEGVYLKELIWLKTLPNQIQGAGTSCGSLAPPGNKCCSQRGALDRQGRRSSQAVSLFSLDKDPIQDLSDFPNKIWLEKTMFP